jgi:hypothetical protein
MKININTGGRIIRTLRFLAILLWCHPSLTAADLPASNSVAVLDFKIANPTSNREQVKVAADFVEMALQREGVATLERRQIHQLLAERNLWRDGVISSSSIHAAQLPLPEFFVEGTIREGVSNRFSVDVALVGAQTAILETSFSAEGKFPDEWDSAPR